jgi:long-chain acyl-CoA synthetase
VGPKGVMLDHANLDAVCHSVIDAFGLTRADHSLILPPFHVHGIVVGTLSPLLAGGAATAAGRFSAQTFFERLEQTRATYFCAASTIFTMLSALADDMRPDTSSVRFAICDAAPAPAELLQRFESRYHIPIIEGYGPPEGSCANTANPVNGQRKRGTVGVSLPGQTIRLVDSCGRPVPDGELGEILIKGPNVMRGYLNRPKETAKTIVDGWLHTGDFGRFDEDRYLVLVDRAADKRIRGGDRIHPREIEAGVYQLPQVAGAAVISPPVDGEKPVLFVALHRNAELSAEQIHAHLGTLLGKYELPVDITVLDELPRSADGEVDKPGLQRLSARPD